MNQARNVKHSIIYNFNDISEYVTGIGYTDNTDSTDDISVQLADRAEQWFGEWFPETGDTLTASMEVLNWLQQGDNNKIEFGSFEVDNVEMGDAVTINAVSVPITSSIRSEEKTKGWESLNLNKIASEIAGNAGLALVYDTDVDPFYDRSDQNNISDLSFLEDLCKSDGLCVKISDGQLIIFEESKYDTLPAVAVIEKGVSFIVGYPKFRRNAKNIYTACEIAFRDSKTDKTYRARFDAPIVGNVGHTLKINESFNSESDDMNLERKARARLREQNKNEWTLDITMADGRFYYAGTNIDIKGWYRFDGKYHVQTVKYNISSSGFTTDISMRKCLEGY